MNVDAFMSTFEHFFPINELSNATVLFEDRFMRSFFDPCFSVNGMSSIKKQMLLGLAAQGVSPDECYLEIGTYTGKSLISAMLSGSACTYYACDNFSLFKETNSLSTLVENLKRYKLEDRVTLFNDDFRQILRCELIKEPVGVYFYDGAHDFDSQYDAIRLAEPLLSPAALVIVDDWRFADDSHSHAKEATEQAISESRRNWRLLYDLKARYNGDHAMWWNGVAVYATNSP